MSGFISKLSIGSILFSALALFGCSSGGDSGAAGGAGTPVSYAGLSSPSAVNASNAEAVSTAGGESVQHGADSSSSRVFGVEIADSPVDLEMLSRNLASAMATASSHDLPSAYTITGSCGGSVIIPDEQVNSYNTASGPVTFTMTFTSYCDGSIGTQYTINGQVLFNYLDRANPSAGFTIQYRAVTVNDGSGPITINMTIDCSDTTTCSIVSDYVGGDGSIYRVADFSFYGDAATGFNGTATFYHPGHGSVSITASNVTYGGCGDFPDGGSVTANGTTGSAQILFNSDCSYVINYDDGAGDTGVINGSYI